MRLINGDGRATGAAPDRSLVRLLVQARGWWAELRKGEVNITELAEREGVQDAYITRVVRLAFLSPSVIEAIVKGQQPAQLSGTTLITGSGGPTQWTTQQELLMG